MKERLLNNLEHRESTGIKNKQEILNYSPEDLSNYLEQLEIKGELEKFLEQSSSDETLSAQFSYWEKWLGERQQGLLDELIKKKKEIYPGEKETLPLNLEKKFSKEDLELIFSNIGAIQLTFGCTKGCPFCAFDAIHRKKDSIESIPYSQLVNLFKNYGKCIGKTRPLLYWASEPSDYASQEGMEDRTYEDVHQLAILYADYSPVITSRNLSNEWLEFMNKQENARVSTDNLSDDKFKIIPKKLLGGSTSPESAHLEYMGFASKSKGYKNDKGVTMDGFVVDGRMPDGRTVGGIGCFDGVLLSPRGIYNVIQLYYISKEYPQCQIIEPIEELVESHKIQIGDDIKKVLRSSIVYRRGLNSFTAAKYRLNKYNIGKPKFYSLVFKDGLFDVATGEDNEIIQIIPRLYHEDCEW